MTSIHMQQIDAVFYDIDQGNKKSLAHSVAVSPLRYSIIRSQAPRFTDHDQGVPFGVYNTDTAHKQSLESFARDNRRFYSSVFQSTANRFGRPWTSPSTDALYTVDKMSNSQPATIEHSLDSTSRNYSILGSSFQRFQGRAQGQGSDVIYEIDHGHKMSLYTSMLRSPIKYSNVKVAQSAEGLPIGRKLPLRHDHQVLGPGVYDSKRTADIPSSPYDAIRPLSSMASRTPRFGKSRGAGGGLGSTWTPDKDNKAWAAKGFHMSKAELLRPQYLPKSYGPKRDQAGALDGKSAKQ